MDRLLNQLLGIHPAALKLQAARAEILSANMANADTPQYKAQDIDFQQILQQQFGNQSNDLSLMRRNANHITDSDLAENQLYRTPTQASLDGNTVETHVEKAHFMENALRYQISTQLVSGKFSGFTKALKGE